MTEASPLYWDLLMRRGIAIDLKFSNMRLLRTGENVEAYPARDHWRKAIHLLMPDGLTGRYAFPRIAHPYFDCIFLDVLAVIEPFHGTYSIDAGWFR